MFLEEPSPKFPVAEDGMSENPFVAYGTLIDDIAISSNSAARA